MSSTENYRERHKEMKLGSNNNTKLMKSTKILDKLASAGHREPKITKDDQSTGHYSHLQYLKDFEQNIQSTKSSYFNFFLQLAN